MEIRLAKINDLEDIAMIEQVCFPQTEAANYQSIKNRLITFRENFVVAVIDGKIVGFINGCTTDQPVLSDELYDDVSLHKKNGEYMTVFGLDVLPSYQHRGIASQLMNTYIDIARKRHKKGIVLTCKECLIGFYERFGYVYQGISASQHGGVKWNDMLLLLD